MFKGYSGLNTIHALDRLLHQLKKTDVYVSINKPGSNLASQCVRPWVAVMLEHAFNDDLFKELWVHFIESTRKLIALGY